jgi:16S rRNA (cytidine1402-2'-O)-methyltransferase
VPDDDLSGTDRLVNTPAAPGTLFIVSTPIGNLGDISVRALEVLRTCGLVLAEDTRQTRVLLSHAAIKTAVVSLREHNEARVTPRVVARLLRGETAALVSDAGTPLISDPGERLVRAVIDAGFPVVPIPGASAVLAALVVSGLPAVPFTFFGFVPRKGRERSELLDQLAGLGHTAICYESPERLADTLEAWVEAGLGERPAVVARELTKRFEEVRRGTVRELAAYHSTNPPRGEVVVVLGGAPVLAPNEETLESLARAWRGEGLPAREVARRLTEEHGAPRNLAYKLAHQ